jgi:hypothetical protein
MAKQRNKRAKSKKRSKKSQKRPKTIQKQPNLAELQAIWYKKLADTGFKDLETFSKRPGAAALVNQPLLSGSTYGLGQRANPETLHHYRRVDCWLAYNADLLKPQLRRVLELYSGGMPYRAILATLEEEGLTRPKRLNLYSLHKTLKTWLLKIKQWNRVEPQGLDFKSDL